jgi:ubiquinone/menaquinone biosynthesis C-methylase UbiE
MNGSIPRDLAAADRALTAITRRRYDRIAGIYDSVESLLELSARAWRRDLWLRVEAGNVLELGVGTGRNLRFYRQDQAITAVDLSERMLARAERKAKLLHANVRLELADVECLPFADGVFDAVVATFLLCSVPNPHVGLLEARRVLKPGGQLILLEHVLSARPIMRTLMRAIDPLAVRLWGAHVNRETVGVVAAAGFRDVTALDLFLDVVKRIEARAPA